MTDSTWAPVELTDAEREAFPTSLWAELGYSPRKCPTCNCYIRNGICLNACHLNTGAYIRFQQSLRANSAAMRSDPE